MRSLADCHLHLEGSLPASTLEALARRAESPYADFAVFDAARRSVRDSAGFLSLFAGICRLFRGADDYAQAARAVGESLAADGVGYAEIYVSPEIFNRMKLPAEECLAAIAEEFAARPGGCDCRILLDVVRQWGPDSANRVLDLHEKSRHPPVVGFGMGGDENSIPASEFAGVYARARSLGLRTSVHAGEWAGTASVEEALDHLRPERIDHGIAAASSPPLLRRLAAEGTTLCVAPTSNVATGAVASFEDHPIRSLLDAGVSVALSADDPLLFATTTSGEYAAVERRLGFDGPLLEKLAETSWRARFGS
jgi:adenosine deaminase